MNAKLMGLVVAGGLLAASSVNAAEFGRYSFNGTSASGGAGPDGVVDAQPVGGSFSNFTMTGVTVSDQTSAGRFGATAWSTNTSISTADHFDFSFTPNIAGVTLTELRFHQSRDANGPTDLVVRSSKTGTTGLTSPTPLNPAPSSGDIIINLAAIPAFQSALTQGQAVTFSIFAYDAGTSGGLFSVDNVILSGEGLIPEPASLGLIGLGALALLRRRA